MHRENDRLSRWATVVGVIAVVALALDLTIGLSGIGVCVFIVGGLTATTLWSVQRYLRIRLEPGLLTVGKERFVPHDFDAGFGVRGADVLSDDEKIRLLRTARGTADGTIRIAGGSWGRTAGMRAVVLVQVSDGRRVAIFTRDPRRLTSILAAWLEGRAF